MALDATIGGNGFLFVGEDKTLQLELLDSTYNPGLVGSGIPVDMTGWSLIFDVRLKDNSAAPALLSVVPTLVGVYNAVRASNTQRAQVVLTDAETSTFSAKTYRHSWKRLDFGSETVLAWGDFTLQMATSSLD